MKNKFQNDPSQYIHNINSKNFKNIALELFRFQSEHNIIYKQYLEALHIIPEQIQKLTDIPFLPISFFKSHEVTCVENTTPELIFESSGTTGENTSKHLVFDKAVYETSLISGFTESYGAIDEFVILALLPSYLERKNASLVHMAKVLMQESQHPDNGFFLYNFEELANTLQRLEAQHQKTLLLGVSFALLDFAEAFPMQLRHTIVMETGGMKGRKEEWTRTQLHDFLKTKWQLEQVHSEYGMTELLSQAYAKKDGLFLPSSTMKVLVRDINDPFDIKTTGSGCLNIIDLANTDSCAFIATEDIGHIYENGSFEVLGRMDHSALRGCSLMAV